MKFRKKTYLDINKLDFGSVIYNAACKAPLNKLNSILNKGIQTLIGAFRISQAESLSIE